MLPKRKNRVFRDDDDLNDGSGSDDSDVGYMPRQAAPRIHYVQDESTTVTTTGGRIRYNKSTVPTPASPAKKSQHKIQEAPPLSQTPNDNVRESWDADFADFDAEYGPGLEKEARDLRDSDNPHGVVRGIKECIKSGHNRAPLHHIEHWNGHFFDRCSLKSLGVRIQLGHPPGEPCVNPEKAWGDSFVIIGSHTIDEVGLDYCNCSTTKTKHVQLLRMRLYPATGTNPRCATTFGALRRFAHMTLESKCSPYKFYNSLARETNNTGLNPSRDRYEEFMRMTRQWQHLMLLKRGGRGHDPCDDQVNATKPGELALLCLACPHPEKNLPENWRDIPFEKAFIYALYLALNANFRLHRKDVSSEERDPGLSKGWAFFGDVEKYMAHLKKHWDQPQEWSTCVAHDAVDKPDREVLGTVSSGIGTVDCARHNMKHPLGVGDLQRGERYLNMDYMLYMSLAASLIYHLFISYNIACQWYKNLGTCQQIFDPDIQFKHGEKHIVFLVPKFHLPAHVEQCNINFSFNLTPFVGRTDGEAPERGWADTNWLANSTRVSGPVLQLEEDSKASPVLLDKMQKAVPLMIETREAWIDAEAAYPPSVIKTWTAMAVAWEADGTSPNPFASSVKHDDLREVCLRLAHLASADKDPDHVRGDMHVTEMVSMGLQLEKSQRALKKHWDSVGLHETPDQGRNRVERETKLRRKIEAWMAVQQLFIPDVVLLHEREDAERKRIAVTQALPGMKAQDMKLWLPSEVGTRARCEESLQDYEYQLRRGQAYRYRDGMHGVKAKVRSGLRTDTIQVRVDSAAEDYRAAQASLVKLGGLLGRTEWQEFFPPLKVEDVRGRPSAIFGDEERQRGKGKKKKAQLDPRRTPLRIDWAKTRAKAMRYAEEVDLLEEEMRRVKQFLDWHAGWWRSLVGLRSSGQDEALREGHTVYAAKQAAYLDGMRDSFATMWRDIPTFLDGARATYNTMKTDEPPADLDGEDEGDEEEDEEDDAL
ncbi:hypothetical protein B0H14DRAFT_3492715 [Mycena olivaceomarginata]|nr:hypothetical protein B0H14DRAFT_3492715 [Mycena olivaceomarginata]